MPSNESSCPIWEDAPNASVMVEDSFAFDIMRPASGIEQQDVDEGKHSKLFYSLRAGGHFRLNKPGAFLLEDLNDRQRVNLSYWIYRHNHPYWLLFGASPDQAVEPPVLDEEWVKQHRDCTPSSSDRVLTFLCELIRADNTGEQPKEEDDYLMRAAGGCRNANDESELKQHAVAQGWLGIRDSFGRQRDLINLSGRMHVEEQLRDLGRGRNGFVAMWFDNSMATVFENGIAPAIEDAGYTPVRIDRQEFLGKVDDEIMAEIRKSRFVVADFTTSEESGARGGVYYEAGFAQGLDIPVIHTCRQDRMQAVHFDTNHFNHITWETPEDLRTQLHRRIEATLGRGPGAPPTEGRGGVR